MTTREWLKNHEETVLLRREHVTRTTNHFQHPAAEDMDSCKPHISNGIHRILPRLYATDARTDITDHHCPIEINAILVIRTRTDLRTQRDSATTHRNESEPRDEIALLKREAIRVSDTLRRISTTREGTKLSGDIAITRAKRLIKSLRNKQAGPPETETE
jgi:hypothetical protein